jgi:lipopolysaccharide biosynthesis protein
LAVEDDPGRNLWGDTRRMAEALAARMGGRIALHPLEFFAGTMFWARPRAFEPLRRLRLAKESFAAEADQIDGTLEHTVERLFIHVARHSGFRVEAVAVDGEPTADTPRPSKTTLRA